MDGDGDQDIIESTGACCPPFLFINEGGRFLEQAAQHNLTSDGSGRFPSWVDFNNDRRTDIFMARINSLGSGGMILAFQGYIVLPTSGL